jgi:hypothetical protein
VKSMFSIYPLCSRTIGYAALLLLSIPVFGQDSVILKRMGPGDQITSHMYSFGIRGKQFQFVQGEMPKGVQWHGRLTDNDVRKLQDAGAKIVIREPNRLKCFPRSRCCFPHCSLTSAAVAGTSLAGTGWFMGERAPLLGFTAINRQSVTEFAKARFFVDEQKANISI